MFKARVHQTLVASQDGNHWRKRKRPWKNLKSDILHCHIQFPDPGYASKLQFCPKRLSADLKKVFGQINYFLKILFHDSHVTNM